MSVPTAHLDAARLVLSTGGLTREYAWRDGLLATTALLDPASGERWEAAGDRAVFALPGEATVASEGRLRVETFAGNAAWAPHTRAIVECRLGHLELRRVFRLYPGCPAIACDFWLRGHAHGAWRGGSPRPYQVPGPGQVGEVRDGRFHAPLVEHVVIRPRQLRVELAAFSDVTDLRNNLVHREVMLPYRAPSCHIGNVLLAADVLTGAGLFVLKEAPCSDMQLAYPGCDFVITRQELAVVGLGLDPDDLDPERWTRAYSVVTGLAVGGELGLLRALRAYQGAVRCDRPDRDHFVMANTWGDRSQDARVSESFALGELEAGQRFGITHLQLDDGWQQGVSSNSAVAGGSLAGIWDRTDYWVPRAERFPRGLAPVVARGREVGIEVCLWYNPSRDDSYAHWADDARTLIGLYREHGLRIFKIDGVDIPDKRADTNLRAMFDAVLEATDHEVTFNLDTTAGRRCGYHYLTEYGTFFLENRYTDHASYYPHTTLRNLWQLARYVPPQQLQIEFLNLWRNADQYPDDPLAPHRVPFDYAFAITMMAQPLAWFEVQNLPAEGQAIAPLVAGYRRHQAALHAGCILPVGEEPSGVSWTGFQSLGADGGYLLAFREHNERPTARLGVWGLTGAAVELTGVLGAAESGRVRVDADGRLELTLPRPCSFGLWSYRRGADE